MYLYHSETGSVEVHHPTANLLLFFPEVGLAQLSNMELGTPEQDEFELTWVNTSGQEPQRIVVQGHTPRNYPTLYCQIFAPVITACFQFFAGHFTRFYS